jgi:hypothetical protein
MPSSSASAVSNRTMPAPLPPMFGFTITGKESPASFPIIAGSLTTTVRG